MNNFFEKIFCSNKFLVQNFLLLQNHFLGNCLDEINFSRKFFGRRFFIVAKSFPRKQIGRNNFIIENFFVENSLLSQNHFLGNS